ncbi:hypothetical protein PHYPSEUDO_003617, partial [Phytophthora pseudosyringae]
MCALDHLPASPSDNKPATRKTRENRTTDTSAQPSKSPKPAWKRRKEELQRLRLETKALQGQVAFLRLRETHDKLFEA